MAHHRTITTDDLGLRALGALLLAVCWRVVGWLLGAARVAGSHPAGLLPFAAATAGFLCLSLGCLLLVAGKHVRDRIEVSRRWSRRSPAVPPARRDQAPARLDD